MRILVLVAIALLQSGCMSRYVIDVTDGMSGMTLVETVDAKNFVVFAVSKHVFWECTEQQSKLECSKVCDVTDDQGDKVVCPLYVQ